MAKKAAFQWRDLYFGFIQQFDPTLTDPKLTTVRIRREYGELKIAEKHVLDPRETGGKREIVKAIFKSQHGYAVMTTLEGHESGSVYYF